MLVLAACLGAAAGARAHTVGLSTVRIDPQGPVVKVELAVKASDLERALELRLRQPGSDLVDPEALAAAAATVVDYLADRATVHRGDDSLCAARPGMPAADEDGVVLRLSFDCSGGAGGLVYRNRVFHEVDPASRQIVLVEADGETAQALLNTGRRSFVLSEPPPGLLQVAARYVFAGVEHIFIGYDHVAFLIALMLWARQLWPIVKVVTAFTLAHSLTLSLAVLDVVSIPGSVVEPLIAASIVFVAAENFYSRVVARRWRVALFLGLVHGFGFAGALKAYGLPSDALAVALASFNLGVEIGQVVIVAIAVPVLLLADRALSAAADARLSRQSLVYALSTAIGGLGLYWLVERTVFA